MDKGKDGMKRNRVKIHGSCAGRGGNRGDQEAATSRRQRNTAKTELSEKLQVSPCNYRKPFGVVQTHLLN